MNYHYDYDLHLHSLISNLNIEGSADEVPMATA